MLGRLIDVREFIWLFLVGFMMMPISAICQTNVDSQPASSTTYDGRETIVYTSLRPL